MAKLELNVVSHTLQPVVVQDSHPGKVFAPTHNHDDALAILATAKERAEYHKTKINFKESIPCFPWDGAIALRTAVIEQFGEFMMRPVKTIFGEIHPKMVSVADSPSSTQLVPWGRVALPGIEGFIELQAEYSNDGIQFVMYVECEQRHEEAIRKLTVRTRQLSTATSIYSGKIIEVDFDDVDNDIPVIKFITPSPIRPIFNSDCEEAIERNILTPIISTNICRGAGIPLKRNILLPGPYGTGKTLLASYIANISVKHGWTYIYCTSPENLRPTLIFAKRYSPCVVFCEDIDRVASVDRTDEVNDLLNTLDGISSKTDEILLILTSNHANNINAAMRRPGRIDTIIPIQLPERDATHRLATFYAGEFLKPDTDITDLNDALVGFIPATIREIVERSKLEAIRRSSSPLIIPHDIAVTAQDVRREQATLGEPAIKRPEFDLVKLFDMVRTTFNHVESSIDPYVADINYRSMKMDHKLDKIIKMLEANDE